jgi:hypothetical protein
LHEKLSANGQLKGQIISYLKKCPALFEKYKAGDDFTHNKGLYFEVLGTIELELEKDGLQ